MKKLSVQMTKTERILGYIYLPFQLLVLPIIVVFGAMFFRWNMTEAELNVICFAFNFIALTVIFHRYLLDSAKVFFRHPGRALSSCGWGFLLHFGGTYWISLLILTLDPEFSNVNDGALSEMLQESSVLMSIGTILLAPVAEEILFRGVVFGQLHRKWPLAAYILSAAIFSSLHVVGYIGSYPALRLVLCFLQYLPASIALAFVYVRSDTIFAPILMHIVINTIGTLLMQ